MAAILKKYFPMLKERETLLAEIEGEPKLNHSFHRWTEEQQKEFLDFCTGVRGIKFLYDSFFKEIMNPETAPERLEEFLSLILKRKVTILEILPTDSTRIADETSLLIMDIVVQLEDGPIVNLEVQKIGYKFPGERCSCYSSDLLLRQYKRVRSQKKKKFSYKDIKGVYTIVLFEKSPQEFHKFKEVYHHHSRQVFDTGLELNLLQEYVFLALDIYKEIHHNKVINKCEKQFDNRLEAWLGLLCMDEPEVIVQLIEQYPDFKAMYEEAYQLCLNTEEVMRMFSKELAELDRNTTQLMIDEMEETINSQDREIVEQKQVIEEKDQQLEKQNQQLEEKDQKLEEKDQQLEEKDQQLEKQNQQLEEQGRQIQELLERLQAEKLKI